MFKEVCNTLGMSRSELAEKLGLSKTTIDSWSDNSRISKTAKIALELMLENHKLKNIIKNFQEGFASLNLYNLGDNSINNTSKEHINLIQRMRHILNEFKLSEITCAKVMSENNFAKINQILNFKMYPDFDFLEKFTSTLKINHYWLLTGESSPFSNNFIKSNFNSQFINEAEEFDRIYIVTSKNNLDHTRIIVVNRNNEFGLYQTCFCIGSNFIMEARECSDLCDLHEFYQKFKYKISCLEFNEDDYRKLLSLKYYPKNILDCGQTSYMLFDLLDLREDNKEKYSKFFGECIEIIKFTLKDRENKREQIKY